MKNFNSYTVMFLILFLLSTYLPLAAKNIIIEEIEALRKNNPEHKYYQEEIEDGQVKNMLDELDVLKLVELETPEAEKGKKRFFLTNYPVPVLREMLGGLILLNEERAPQTYALVKELADKLEMPVPVIFLSGYKKLRNAFATSLAHSMSCIVLGEDLFRMLDLDEAKTIIAHELGHVKKNHIPKQMAINVASLLVTTAAVYYFFSKYSDLDPDTVIDVLLPAFGLGAILNVAWTPLLSWYSRKCEKEADMLAVKVTQNPRAMAHAFEIFKNKSEQFHRDYQYLIQKIEGSGLPEAIIKAKIAAANWKYKMHKFADWLQRSKFFGTHPTCDERIAYLNAAADELEASARGEALSERAIAA